VEKRKSLLLLKTETLHCGHPPQSLITTLTQLSWLFFTDPAHNRNTDGGVDLQVYSFLTLTLDGVGSQLHAPAAVPPEKEPSHTPLNVGLGVGVGVGAGPFWKMCRRDKFLTVATIAITVSHMSSTTQSLYRPH